LRVRYICDLPDTALALAFSPDGSLLAAGCADRTVRLFDASSGKAGHVLRHHADWVLDVAFSPDGKKFLSASRDRTVRVCSSATGEVESTYTGHDTPVLAAAFTPDGANVLSLGRGKVLHSWPASLPKDVKAKIVSVPSGTSHLATGSFGVVTGAEDSEVRVLAPGDLQTTATLPGHDDAVQSIAIAPAGDVFATGSHSGEVCVWKPGGGKWEVRFVASP
jgi:WD40 repeat protein